MKKKAKEIAETFSLFINSEDFQRIVEMIIDVQSSQNAKALDNFFLRGDSIDNFRQNSPRWYLEFLPTNYKIISDFSSEPPLSEGVIIEFPHIKREIKIMKEKLTSEFENKCKNI